jgi:ABC-type transport system involved in cytochrome bd biosynthesis fused ATPase/permease subunit
MISGSLDDNVFLSGHGGAAGDLFASIGAEGLEKTATGRLGATGRPVSGGERKWIGLARAIASGQPVLLLDEPTSGLDSAAQASVLAALGRLRDTHTVIVVTHQRETLRTADRVVLLGDDGLRGRNAPTTSQTAADVQN